MTTARIGVARQRVSYGLLGFCLLAVGWLTTERYWSSSPDGSTGSPARSAATGLPATRVPVFVPNAGQLDARVRYAAGGPRFDVRLTPSEILFDPRGDLALEFIDGDPLVAPRGRDPDGGKASFARDEDPRRRFTGLATYREVVYPELWPGVDFVLRGAPGRLSRLLVVAPGASLDLVRFAWRGAPPSASASQAPQAWQVVDGVRRAVPVRFVTSERKGRRVFGYAVGAHDPTVPVVIDAG